MVEFMVVTCLLMFSEMAEPVLAHTGPEVKSEAGQRQFDHHEGFILYHTLNTDLLDTWLIVMIKMRMFLTKPQPQIKLL